MAVEMCEIEIWVTVDESGDYAVGKCETSAAEAFEAEIGFNNELGTRRVKITVKVPLPQPIEITGAVAVTEEAGELKAA